MKESIKNKLRENLTRHKVSEDGAGLMDNDVWERLETSLDGTLKNLAKEFGHEFEGGSQEAFGHLVEIINRRYGTNY